MSEVSSAELNESVEMATEAGGTSPGQDATMDNSYNIEPRSPSFMANGSTSPRYGRSVREFEEQMTSLKKENFNLKLRIYFLEEKFPPGGNSSPDAPENLVKQNVDLKIDIEILRKELAEKQTLLCDAAKAMELMESQQKDIEAKHQTIVDELSQKVKFLEMEIKELLAKKPTGQHSLEQLMGHTELAGGINIQQKVRELEGFVKQYEETTKQLKAKNEEFGNLLAEKDKKIRQLEDNVKKLLYDNAELREQLAERIGDTLPAEKFKDDKKVIPSPKSDELDSFVSENKSLKEIIVKLNDELKREKYNSEEKNKKIKEQQNTMEEMQYAKLKEELQDHKKQLADKICLLEVLEAKLKEKTAAHDRSCKAIQELLLKTKILQGEIERLQKSNSSHYVYKSQEEMAFSGESIILSDRSNASETDTKIKMLEKKITKITEQKDAEINKLSLEVRKKTADLQNFVNKVLWEKNREIERLTKVLGQTSSVPVSPVKQVDRTQTSFSEAEFNHAIEHNKYLQKKVDNLVQQIKNLADKQPDSTIQKLKLELREAKEETEKANICKKECAEVCAVLTARLEELAGFLDSLLKHKDVLGALAADRRRAMRKAIDKSLDLSRSWNSMSLSISGMNSFADSSSLIHFSNMSDILDHASENKENQASNMHDENNVSQNQAIENLKAEVKALKKELDKRKSHEIIKKERRSLPISVENQSESETWSEPDRKVSLARIGLEESILNKSMKIPNDETEKTSSASTSDVNRRLKTMKQDKTSQFEMMVTERDNQILQVQCELVEADNRLKEEMIKSTGLKRELEEYKKVNEMLEIEIANFKSRVTSQEYLKKQLEEKVDFIDQITQERDQLITQVYSAETQIGEMKKEIFSLKETHEHEIATIRQEENEKRNHLEKQMNAIFKENYEEQERKHRETLTKDWVSRILYEDNKRQFNEAQNKLNEAQVTIDMLQENERELNMQLLENEKSVKEMKKSLDDNALQASKAILERTKAVNEKLILEDKIKELTSKLETVETEKTELLVKLGKSKFTPEKQKQNVQYNKIRKQSSTGSEASHSGYTSEDVPAGSDGTGALRFDNSSPDLGIESDAGRTSSAEISTVQAALLRTVEISNTGLDVLRDINEDITKLSQDIIDDNAINTSGPKHVHDCEKLEQENAELKKKLTRIKRAYEDTWGKLRAANQRKEQIERDIRQQIMKTHVVLKTVRTNMESELDQ